MLSCRRQPGALWQVIYPPSSHSWGKQGPSCHSADTGPGLRWCFSPADSELLNCMSHTRFLHFLSVCWALEQASFNLNSCPPRRWILLFQSLNFFLRFLTECGLSLALPSLLSIEMQYFCLMISAGLLNVALLLVLIHKGNEVPSSTLKYIIPNARYYLVGTYSRHLS